MKTTKSQRKRENARNVWKQPIAPEDDYTAMGSWASQLQRKLDDVGRWRPCEGVQIVDSDRV